jgi:malate permease and related proteins
MLTSKLLMAVAPLYLMIAAGFVAGRYLGISGSTIGRLVIFVIVPITFTCSVTTLPWDPAWLLMPFVMFMLSSVMAVGMYQLAKLLYPKGDSQINLIAQASGTGNTGYFGLPIFVALYGTEYLGAYMLGVIGISIAESTVCYYLLSRGACTPRESFMRLFKMPALYACSLGILFNYMGLGDHWFIQDTLKNFKGAYIVCGMMVVGAGLAASEHFKIDLKFNSIMFTQRFILWPLLSIAVGTGVLILGLLPPLAIPIIAILSVVPLAANTVAFATYMNIHPDKAALSVLMSTLLAVVYIPLVLPWVLEAF